MLRKLAAAGIPHIPAVLGADVTRRVVDRDCLFMEWLDGELLLNVGPSLSLAERLGLRRQIGAIAGAANAITAPFCGYPGQPRLQARNWRQAFALMVAALLGDARRFDVTLPLSASEITESFERAMPLLDDIEGAHLTHFDLWDGNVLVRRGPDGWAVSGVIDWERAFYGDPLADVVSLTLFDSPRERAALLEGLAEGRGRPHADQRRLALYRAYLWLIMIVEAKPRGLGGSILLPTSSAARRLMRDLAIAAGD